MAVKSPLRMTGALTELPPVVQRKAGVWAASQILTELPDTDPEFQREVLRELLYALGLVTRPEPIAVRADPFNILPEEG
jgi:hypothetical protein